MKKAVVTGGGGFIGAYLVRRLVRDGWKVAVLDNLARGRAARLANVRDDIEWHEADIRDHNAVRPAFRGADVVFHLAAVNGTENFYRHPDLVLDVGLRGALAAVECAAEAGVSDLVVASSAEVYQTPPIVPTDESVPLTLPDSLNPRYSYGGSKIVSELIAFNYHRDQFRKVQVFRPHNVYGPDMGWKHVVPQFILRVLEQAEQHGAGPLPFSIQGDGTETRAFCFVDDIVDGILLMHEKGEHRSVYHIGNGEMVTIADLARQVGDALGRELELQPGEAAPGGTPVRCPDIGKMQALGYSPQVSLSDGVRRTAEWYAANREAPENALL
jgi:UDP-glucose 4-epimerase